MKVSTNHCLDLPVAITDEGQ